MKKIVLFIVAAVFVCHFSGCVSAKFVKTGETYPALDPAADVKVYLTSIPKNYSEVGILVTSGSDLSGRIEQAKKEARKVGANGIIPKNTQRETRQLGSAKYEIDDIDEDSATITKKESNIVVERQEFILIRVE